MIKTLGVAAALGLAASPALAQEKLKIGLLLTLSGPSAVLGQQARDGFQLGLKDLGGKLGGRDVEVIVVDDELKPDVAVTKVKGLLERDKVDFVVGPIFSNVPVAVHKPIDRREHVPYQHQCGPVEPRGQGLQPVLLRPPIRTIRTMRFWARYAQDRGYKKVFLLAPNYQAGKDAIAGFKRHFKGEIVEEVYVPLNKLDFQAELAKIASAKPDAIFTFMPGGMGVNLVKQYRAGRPRRQHPVPVRFHGRRIDAAGTAGCGRRHVRRHHLGAQYRHARRTRSSSPVYEAAYNAVPGSYAMQAYDAALLIDSALKATGGKTDNKDALRAALKKADFKSLRGDFKFGTNGFPIQDFYLVKAAKRPDGKFQTEIVAEGLRRSTPMRTPRNAWRRTDCLFPQRSCVFLSPERRETTLMPGVRVDASAGGTASVGAFCRTQ